MLTQIEVSGWDTNRKSQNLVRGLFTLDEGNLKNLWDVSEVKNR
jgi:hypothetical protein